MSITTHRSSTDSAPKSNESQLSKRQQFRKLKPPPKLFQKLAMLGFGQLPRTKRYQGLNKQLTQYDQPIQEPKYSFPLLSFFAGAKQPSSFPEETLGEVAFVGRSNVGKSSLINTLAESTIVRTSDKPGLTQQINFFNVGKLFHMVDMPGYGYAFADEEKKKNWRELMETYIMKRKTLKRVYVLLDARHGIKIADIEFLDMLSKELIPVYIRRKQVKFQVVLTKADLVKLPELARRIVLAQDHIKQYRNAVKDVIVVSSVKNAGINQFRKEMLFLTGHLESKSFYEAIETKKKESIKMQPKSKNKGQSIQ
ncbi:MAG: P-loop containing nucleoside triphosphate hydrolase protein [Benjaminiella poitrasii]|nr:MAG: P-loop containing nucleoside triphosphate hydrolase protein [Benjaminiella poitrasii]